jgi:lipoprotein-anchoring transpeptidase ErfK/SrfK
VPGATVRPGPTAARRPPARLAAVLATLALLLALAPLTVSAAPAPIRPAAAPAPAPADWAPPRTVYIPETGHTIDGYFLDLWRGGGGYWAFGNPITPESTLDNGHVVQYYQYARFEYWPEGDEFGNVVFLGNVGEDLRPYVVPRRAAPSQAVTNERATSTRSAPAGTLQPAGAATTSAAVELALVAMAWVPLTEDEIRLDSAVYRFVPETGHSVQHGFKAFWEETGEAAYLGNPLTEEYLQGGTTYQVFERGQLAWEPGIDPYMVPVGSVLADRYGLDTSPVYQGDIPTYSEDLFIPPPDPVPDVAHLDPNAERWIEINLSSQYMIAWQGDVPVIESYVSTGKYGFETPPGTFYVNSKIDSQDMEGVIGGEYYNVPGVPYVMYFTNLGHAIHGTYWHSNFGAPMSHGCVNLPMDVAAFVYDWAPYGARVEIHW